MFSSPFILILGMHRSGTSCLAGCLEASGLHLGDVSKRGQFNARGNRELKSVWMLHDQILGLNRGSWHRPPDSIKVHPVHQEQISRVAKALSEKTRIAGVKDPRTLLLLPHWKEILGECCRLVGTYRHPTAVAQSLARRNNMSLTQSLNLWVRYNRELMDQHQLTGFPLVEYDMADSGAYCRTVATVAQQLGLASNTSGVRRFVDRQLNHHSASEIPVPTICREIYDYLKSNALRCQSSDVAPARRLNWWDPGLRLRSLYVQASQAPPNSRFIDE